MSVIGILNTSVGSTNVGDRIIMDACWNEIMAARPHDQYVDFSSHDAMMFNSLKVQWRHVGWNLLCGTNCLSSHMILRPSWAVNLVTARIIKPVTTIGVGWGGYQGRPDVYTRSLLRALLGQGGMLSVRDEYTRQKLTDCGLERVLNTGCATIWNLDSAHCEAIPSARAADVVYTFTDYAANPTHDLETLRHLAREYRVVHIWLQGAGDMPYYESLLPRIRKFTDPDRFRIVPPNLSSYDALLESNDLDYVGTRLHGGIRAMQKFKRALILAVDNRALEMGRDFDLPVMRRDEFEGLPELINAKRATEIRLPVSAITEFRAFLAGREV